MQPTSLTPDSFRQYPAQARKLVVAHIKVLQQVPLSFAPSLLKEAIEYDYKFPCERSAIDAELNTLDALTPMELATWFSAFAQIRLSPALEHFDWVNRPAQFVEELSAYLWSTHQLDAFRKAATAYGEQIKEAAVVAPPPVPRLGIAVIGQQVESYNAPLFRRLREHGTYFDEIRPENGLQALLACAQQRAERHPVPYGHWYIDGGVSANYSPVLTSVSYEALTPVRNALLDKIQTQVSKPGMGPEELRNFLIMLEPAQLGMSANTLLDRFQLKLLTEGSGTQIFSTTFAQWAAREALRRAQALTLLVRFAPRQRQRPMNELLSSASGKAELDPLGSLVDADMAAYYQWVNQQRLPGQEMASFIVWFENHSQALAVGPSFPRGTSSHSPLSLEQLTALAAG